MKYNVFFEESGVIDINLFPSLGDRRTYVIAAGRGSGKTQWVKQYIENYEKAKQQEEKTKLYKNKK